jgi:hypothetical protein
MPIVEIEERNSKKELQIWSIYGKGAKFGGGGGDLAYLWAIIYSGCKKYI